MWRLLKQGFISYAVLSVFILSLSNENLVAQESQANFAQIAIGGGYRTVFTLLNVGSSTLTGNLILTNGQDGNPLTASMTDGNTSVTGSSFAVSIPSGGTKVVAATAVDTSGPTRTGWAHVTSSGGVLGAVATVQLTGASGALQTFVSVLPSTPLSAATVPVDDNVSAGRFTGYAIANRGNDAITVNVQEVNADGSLAASLDSLSIPAGKQVAAFLFQDSKASQTFQGSAVFTGQGGATFSVVGLAMNQGILAAIPVIPVAVQPPMVADVVFALTLPQGNTIEFQGQTLTAAPPGGIVYFKNLAPGTYEINGTLAGGARTTVIRFLNGGGSIGRGGIVPRSIKSLAGPTGCPMGHASMLMSCMASYTVGTSKTPQYFKLQFTVTAETSVACKSGACDNYDGSR